MSSMLFAPAIIPATRQGTFSHAFTPHGRLIRTCSATRSSRPARWASAITGIRPRPQHQMRTIKRRGHLRQLMQQSHLTGAPPGQERS